MCGVGLYAPELGRGPGIGVLDARGHWQVLVVVGGMASYADA